MRRLVQLVALAVLGLLVTIPAWSDGGGSGDGAGEPTRITRYHADFTVDRDGDLSVVEEITVDFPAGIARHGIFRFFDTHDASAPHARRIPEDIEVTQDGAPAVVDLSWESGKRQRVVRIGDANRYVDPGAHVYTISYRIAGVLEPGTDGTTSQFYWNLVPGDWQQAIDRARLRVNLPAAAQDVRCAVGQGATSGCQASGAGTERLVVTATDLPPRTPVTLKTGLDVPTPQAGTTLPWTGRWDDVLGRHVGTPIAAGVLALLSGLVAALLARRARERRPGFPLQYAPPEGIGPAQAQYILTERVPREAYIASVLHAAEQGAVSLEQGEDSWTITDTGKGWQGLDTGTTEVFRLIGSPRGSFTASSTGVAEGQRLKNLIGQFDEQIKAWGVESGNLSKLGGAGLAALLAVAGLIGAIAVVVFNPFGATVWAFVPGAFGVLGVSLLAAGATTVRTRGGRDLWSRVGGFHRILSTPSAEARFDFAGRQELYAAYLPWAVAFGCADAWARKYRTEVGSEPPLPAYFAGAYAGDHTGDIARSMVDSFESTVGSAISSYEATQSSSSSSSGGGFSGGGGGGGGGGGSW